MGEKEKFLFTVLCQLVIVGEVMKTGNPPFKNHQSGGEFRQEPAKGTKAGGWRFKEVKGSDVVLEYLPSKH